MAAIAGGIILAAVLFALLPVLVAAALFGVAYYLLGSAVSTNTGALLFVAAIGAAIGWFVRKDRIAYAEAMKHPIGAPRKSRNGEAWDD